MHAEGFATRRQDLLGWPIVIETYQAGDVFFCTVSSADAGARFARAQASTREDAERVALEKAQRWLGQTRRFSAAP